MRWKLTTTCIVAILLLCVWCDQSKEEPGAASDVVASGDLRFVKAWIDQERTGVPDELFLKDRLHLEEEGHKLRDALVRPLPEMNR